MPLYIYYVLNIQLNSFFHSIDFGLSRKLDSQYEFYTIFI